MQKCRKLLQITMSLIRWSKFSSVDDPDPENKFIIINLSSKILSTVGRLA